MVSHAVTGGMHWHVTLCTTLRVHASYRCFSRFSGLQRHDNSLTKGQQLLYFVVLQNYHVYLRPPVFATNWLQSMRFGLVSVGPCRGQMHLIVEKRTAARGSYTTEVVASMSSKRAKSVQLV
jgi:hypothetical protein